MLTTKQLGFVVALVGASLAVPFFIQAPEAFSASSGEIPPFLMGAVSLGAGSILLFLSWKTAHLSAAHIPTLTLLGVAMLFGAVLGTLQSSPADNTWFVFVETIVRIAGSLVVTVGSWKLSRALKAG
jgi:ABC-type thiamin/hydroxymethylpyrimidine transport system permease subunit